MLRHSRPADGASGDPLEIRAAEKGLDYVKLDGVIGNGARRGDALFRDVHDRGLSERSRP